jgi:two-component system, OmpR family, phosphate regulon sensor histidine kinase PhoR
MYSLKIQLFLSSFVSAVGGIISIYFFFHSPLLAILGVISSITISFGILYFFVYRPLQKIQSVISAQEDKTSLMRAHVNSSDEMQKLSDALNSLLETFRADIVRMEKLERVRSEFLGNVSHELRTPIFSTQGLIETLLNGAVDDPKVNRNFLQRSLNNIERLDELLADLIDISRIESGEMKLRFRFFNLIELFQSVISEMKTRADQHSMKISLVGNVENELSVFGDKDRLRQVLVNLIDNAIKYSDDNGKILVKFFETQDSVEITVEDEGIGIPAHHLPRIFERFYRVDKDRSREVGGTGLGLAIVKHILEAHNSSITVTSEVGEGTKFKFPVWKSSTI